MSNNFYNKILIVLVLTLSFFAAKAEDIKETGIHQYEFYFGTFDNILATCCLWFFWVRHFAPF